MQAHRFVPRMMLMAAGTLLIAISVAAVRARADVWDKRTVLSVNQPIQVEETYLEPGTYVLKLQNSNADRHIVQIYSRDESRLINTVLAIPNHRLQPDGDSRFSFYETPPGTARAMRAWFYPGDNYGQEFRYPRQLRQIAVAVAPELKRPVAEPEPEPAPPPEVPEVREPQPQAAIEEPIRDEPEVIAQNSPEPESPRAEPVPAPEQPSAPEQPRAEEPPLPSTATWFPMIGLGGLLALGAYGLLRVSRLS